MDDPILFMILLQIVLILLNAIFACAEIAIISMNDNKLAKMASEGDKRAKRLVYLTSQPARFLATIQVAITLSGFLGSAFAAENFSGVLVDWLIGLGVPVPADVLDSISVVVITVILSYFTLVFGELVPKQIAMKKSEPLALGLSGLISAISKIFAPIVSFLTFSTNSILKLFGIDPNAEDDNVSEEEIRMMVDVGSEKGTIDNEERELIQNIFEFDDLSADEILTHRTDVIMLAIEDSLEDWKETLYKTRHTLYPVCDGSVDKIIGVLNAKDYFRMRSEKTLENIMKEAISPAYFVPDTIKADTLFRKMKKEKHIMAVVLDEYGGVTGIITINDLVEQLVGDLGNNDEEEVELITQIADNTWQVHGSAFMDDVSEILGISLVGEDYDTFNGFIFHTLESIPEDGTDMEIIIGDLVIKLTEIENHQVETAIIYKPVSAEKETK